MEKPKKLETILDKPKTFKDYVTHMIEYEKKNEEDFLKHEIDFDHEGGYLKHATELKKKKNKILGLEYKNIGKEVEKINFTDEDLDFLMTVFMSDHMTFINSKSDGNPVYDADGNLRLTEKGTPMRFNKLHQIKEKGKAFEWTYKLAKAIGDPDIIQKLCNIANDHSDKKKAFKGLDNFIFQDNNTSGYRNRLESVNRLHIKDKADLCQQINYLKEALDELTGQVQEFDDLDSFCPSNHQNCELTGSTDCELAGSTAGSTAEQVEDYDLEAMD